MGLVLVFRRKFHEYAGTGWHLYFTNECSVCRARHLKIEDIGKDTSTAESLGLTGNKKDEPVCMCGSKTRYPALEYRCHNHAHLKDEHGNLVPLLVDGKTVPCVGGGRLPWAWPGEKPKGFNGVIPGHQVDKEGKTVFVNGKPIPTFHCPCQQPIPYPIHVKEFRDHLTATPKWGLGDGRDISPRAHDTWLEGGDGEYTYTKGDPGF